MVVWQCPLPCGGPPQEEETPAHVSPPLSSEGRWDTPSMPCGRRGEKRAVTAADVVPVLWSIASIPREQEESSWTMKESGTTPCGATVGTRGKKVESGKGLVKGRGGKRKADHMLVERRGIDAARLEFSLRPSAVGGRKKGQTHPLPPSRPICSTEFKRTKALRSDTPRIHCIHTKNKCIGVCWHVCLQ